MSKSSELHCEKQHHFLPSLQKSGENPKSSVQIFKKLNSLKLIQRAQENFYSFGFIKPCFLNLRKNNKKCCQKLKLFRNFFGNQDFCQLFSQDFLQLFSQTWILAFFSQWFFFASSGSREGFKIQLISAFRRFLMRRAISLISKVCWSLMMSVGAN